MLVKLVTDKFAEVQKQKKPKNPCDEVVILTKQVVTKPRIEKILFKLIDESKIKQDYTIEDMGAILKLLTPIVYEDVMEEESEMFINYEKEKVKRTIGKVVPAIVKEVLKELNKI